MIGKKIGPNEEKLPVDGTANFGESVQGVITVLLPAYDPVQ